MNIAIAEESEIYAKALLKIIGGLEHSVMRLKFIEETKEYLNKNIVDIIILELNFEDGSGLEIVKYLREEKKDRSTYIILLTAETNEEAVTEMYELGIDYYIRKPFSPALLKSLLDRIGQRIDEFTCVLKDR